MRGGAVQFLTQKALAWKKVRGSDEQTGEREGEGEAGEGGPMAMARGERSSQPR